MRNGHRLFFYISSLIFFSFESFASEGPADIAHSRAWKKLVHWERDLLWMKRSQPDGRSFYLSPHGKTDLSAELAATLAAFENEPQSRCSFPARWLLISRVYPSAKLTGDLSHCAKFQEFRQGLSAKSATLVFSSYYLNAPASAFGHTFMRINKSLHDAPKESKRELLDAGVNFGANQTTSNPFLYPIFGLTGLFKGELARLPYYFKVREYGDFEARDLWEYNLNLSQDEVDLLVAHIWELGHTYFDYFYLSENCSYHMLTLLEAAAPRLHLTDRLPPWTIPSETIRVAASEKGLIHSIDYRPSMRSVFYAKSQNLPASDQTWIKRLAIEENSGEIAKFLAIETENPRRIRVLDAASDYVDYLHPSTQVNADNRGPWAKSKLNLLSARAKLGLGELTELPTPLDESPQLGHPSRRWGFRYQSADQARLLFDFRFALRDRFDPLYGYPSGSALEFLKFTGGIGTDRKNPRIDEATIVSVSTMNSMNTFDRKASWKVKVGLRRESLWRCGSCMPLGAEFGYGAHFALLSKQKVMLSALVEGDLLFSRSFTHGIAIYAGPLIEISRRTHDALAFSIFYSGRTKATKDLLYADRAGMKIFFDLTRRLQLHGGIEFEKAYLAGPNRNQLWQVGFHHYY